jgi:hypothetical protein
MSHKPSPAPARREPSGRLASTDGRCPVCSSYKYTDAPGVWRRAICLDCEQVYIRLTVCEAFLHRSKNRGGSSGPAGWRRSKPNDKAPPARSGGNGGAERKP